MRKIISKQEKEKKKKRNRLIIGGSLIIAMYVFSLIGYAFQGHVSNAASKNSTKEIMYNKINFLNQNGFWVANYNQNKFVFTYNPMQIELLDTINFTRNIKDLLNQPLYIYSDNNYNAESEIRTNLLPFVNRIQDACPEGVRCNQKNQDIPIKDCSNNFIIIQNGTQGVRQEQNCIFISGNGQDLIKTIDSVLFKIIGIEQ